MDFYVPETIWEAAAGGCTVLCLACFDRRAERAGVDYSGAIVVMGAIADVTLSFSELKYAFECPYSFKLRFLYGFSPPIAEALGYGKGLHDALFEMHDRVLHGEEVDADSVPELVERHVFLPFAFDELRRTLSAAAERRLEDYVAARGATFADIEHAERPIEIDLGDGIRGIWRVRAENRSKPRR